MRNEGCLVPGIRCFQPIAHCTPPGAKVCRMPGKSYLYSGPQADLFIVQPAG
jgi:hypothetical protein